MVEYAEEQDTSISTYGKLLEYADMQNIATTLDDEKLVKLGAEVVEGYDADRKDRGPWEAKMKEAMDLALQVEKNKDFPWEGCSNVMMPIITEAIIQYSSRMYPALIPPVDIVKARVVGEDPQGTKQQTAIRVSKHMSYQILEEDEEWETEMDRGFIIQPLLGQFYKKIYHDNINRAEVLSPNEFVMVNNAKSVEKSYRKTHYFPMTANDIKSEQLKGNFLDVEIGLPSEKTEEETRQTSRIDDSTPFLMLEQHYWIDLDKDGLMEPYICTVIHETRQVMRITAGYDPEKIVTNDEGIVVEVPQEQYFVKYGFIPNPDGSIMDLGFGQLLGPLNKQINTNINQLNDAGTLANAGGGMIGRGVKMKNGVIKRRIGEYIGVNNSGTDLSRNVVHFPQNPPSQVLFSLLTMMTTAAQRIASTLDSQVGENPGQNQKATTTMAVQEEGKRIFSGIYKRNHKSLKRELKRWFYLNTLYLDEKDYANVIDFPANVSAVVRQADYNMNTVNIIPAADSNYTSQQMKLAKANALFQKIATGLINPQVAMQMVLEAEEQPNIQQLMTLPKPQPPFEVIKHNDEMQIRRAEILLKTLSAEQDWINNEIMTMSQAMLNLARAESEEAGRQYDDYSQQLEILREMANQNVLRMKQVTQPTAEQPTTEQQEAM